MESTRRRKTPAVFESLVRPLEAGTAKVLNSIADFLHGKPSNLFNVPQKKRIELPRDMYAHSDVQTEWWYYTGHCTTESGKQFGFEFVFFKRQTNHDFLGFLPLRLLGNPMFAAHFAFTEIDGNRFRFNDRKSFRYPFDMPASASADKLELNLGDWKVFEQHGSQVLVASLGNDLKFHARLSNTKPAALNGHEKSIKSSEDQIETSKHFSFTRMTVTGEISENGKCDSFTGSAWMDREFGTWYQRNWDWFSIQLDDNTELMIYEFRPHSNFVEHVSHATFVDDNGNCVYLERGDFSIEPIDFWKSPATGIEYPSGWKLTVARLGLELEIKPFLKNQELDTRNTTMISYWEGACEVSGKRLTEKITGKAYAELVGYDRQNDQPTLAQFLASFYKKP